MGADAGEADVALGVGGGLVPAGARADARRPGARRLRADLAQFAIMGSMYARSVLMIEKPRVGLLSIGEEESKGNELTREALQVMKQLPIRFIGNVEGRDLDNGHADVIVCDGFVGNEALKTSEGLGRMVREMLRESLMSTVSGRAGALLARRGFKEFKKRFDQSETVARRCWACADRASSRTAQRIIARSSTASGWRRNLLRPA